MPGSNEKLIFLAEMLGGDRDARKVLADLCEEEGDAGLAQWARSRKKSKPKSIEFALCVLPIRFGLRLTIDFFEHAISYGREWEELSSRLSIIKTWANSDSVDELDAVKVCEASTGFRDLKWAIDEQIRTQDWHSGMRLPLNLESVEAAVNSTIKAVTSIATGELTSFRRYRSDSHVHFRKLARSTRDLANELDGPRHVEPATDQVEWQFRHLRQAIEVQMSR